MALFAPDGSVRVTLAGNGFPRILAQSATAVAVTGSTTETTVASVSIPGGTIGANGGLRVTFGFNYTNSANDKTLRLKLGSTTFTELVRTTLQTDYQIRHIFNRGAENSQIAAYLAGSIGGLAAAPVTGTEDTSGDLTLALTAQLESGAETITFDYWLVELLRT